MMKYWYLVGVILVQEWDRMGTIFDGCPWTEGSFILEIHRMFSYNQQFQLSLAFLEAGEKEDQNLNENEEDQDNHDK